MSFFAELKRRNVVRVGVAYAVIGWVLAQIAEFAFENFGAPDWVLKTFVVVLLLGLPLALFFAWAFEITPEGLKREKDVDRGRSIATQTGRKLDFIIIGVMSIAIVVFAWDRFFLQTDSTPDDNADAVAGADDRVSIAVLPLDNMSGDPTQQYFSDGMTEEIISKLALIDGLRVISRTTVQHHKDSGLDVPAIAEALNVGFVLEGSVRKADNRIRVTAQLIQTSDDSHLWADNFDATIDDVFSVQETIAREIVDSLGVHLTDSAAEALARKPTSSVSAYDAYLKGQALVERWNVREMLDASRAYFMQALALDPDYPNALAGLASAEAQTYRNFDPDLQRLDRADDLLDRATAIDPTLYRATLTRGELMAVRFDYAGASEQFQRAVERDPSDYFAWDLLCWTLAYETPPRGEEAEAACRRGLQIAPNYGEFYYHLARALVAQNRYDEAMQAIDELRRIFPGSQLVDIGLAWVYLAEKDYEAALRHFEVNDKDTALILAARAAAHSGMNEPDVAIGLLENALEKGFGDIAWIEASEHFAAMRALPDYEEVLNQYSPAIK